VAEESRRKTAQTLIQDVRTAFWRMASTQKLSGDIDTILANARQALQNARKIEKERLQSPLDSLQYQKNLLEIIRNLENLSGNLRLAKTELASLLGLPSSQDFTLDVPENSLSELPELKLSIAQMEDLALQLRPELKQEIYNNRITAEETHIAMLRLLPGIEFRADYHRDDNSFLLNNSWHEISGLITYNLMDLIKAPARFDQIELEEKLGETRRLSVYMAVVTQVHLSYQQYLIAKHEYQRINELDMINQKIFHHINNAAKSKAKSQSEQIWVATDALMSRLQLLESYAGIQSSLGTIYLSMGLDPLPEWIEKYDVDTLASSIEAIDKQWQAGSFLNLRTEISQNTVNN